MSNPTYEELAQQVRSLQADLKSVRRKEREKALSELKWQWQTTFDAVGVSICVLDVDWNILQCNSATADLLEKVPDEIIGNKCYELMHGTSQPPKSCPVHQLLKTRKRTVEVLAQDNRLLEVSADPILDQSGNLQGIVHIVEDITARRQLEEELSRIFNMSLDMLSIADLKTAEFTKVNPAFTETLGYSQDQLLGRPFFDFIHPQDVQFTHRIMEEKLAKGVRVINFENRFRCLDGSYRWLNWVSHPDLERGVTYAVAHDVTKRKQAERSLLLFKSAVETSSDAIGLATPEGRHWYQNMAFDDLFGDVGPDPTSSVYVDKTVGHQIFQSIKAGHAWSGEVEMIGKDKRIKHILLRAYAVKDPWGKIASLVSVHTDISDRKRFERDLRHSEMRFRALAELLPQTVFEMNISGRLTFVNNNALRVFGYTPNDFLQGLYARDMIAPRDRERAMDTIQAIMQNDAGFEGRKYNAVKKDGTVFPVLIYSTVDTDEYGEKGLRGIIIDISEQEKLAQEKSKLEEQYIHAQKMEAVGRLAGGVAHDLNNMLSPIVGYGELLLNAMTPDAPNRHAIEQIFSAGQRAKDMVRQLLAFSRKQALEIKSINIDNVLAGFEKLLNRILRDDVKLELKIGSGIPNILADAGQIEQVIMNLAVNAQDAMPNGGRITIEVGTARLLGEDAGFYAVPSPGLYVVVTFSDTGHGMDLETQERIFDPFFTTKGQGKGTGLGLATVYGIIKQHNGSIRVYSEPGKGTVFHLYFPAALSESESLPEQEEKPEDFSGSETVLIVEDNNAVRDLAERILQKHGYQTIAVTGGEECRTVLAERTRFDMLLTDVVLQDTNGKELYQLVKAHYPDISVLYMSGYTDDVIVHHGVLEQGVCFIQKPFSVQGLLRKVRQVLDKKKTEASRAGIFKGSQ